MFFKYFFYDCLLFLAMYAYCMYSTELSHNNSLTYLLFTNIMKILCAVTVIDLQIWHVFGECIATGKTERW